MAHTHQHTEYKDTNRHGKAFAIGIGLNVAFVAIEVIYGLLANSSALLADAGHNASDVLGLVFAWTAAWMAGIKPKGKYTYGLRKTTILVSILNALMLFGAVFLIARDAVGKFKDPDPVAGTQVMIVAAVGVVINTLTALLFMKGQKNDLNVKGAFLHMAADAGVSLGVVVAGLLITLTGKQWIDPVMSFVIIGVILWGTWRLFTDALDLALDAVPKNINIRKIRELILAQDGVAGLHDLHVWALSTNENALSVHIKTQIPDTDALLLTLRDILIHDFGISHSTIQIEKEIGDLDCEKC